MNIYLYCGYSLADCFLGGDLDGLGCVIIGAVFAGKLVVEDTDGLESLICVSLVAGGGDGSSFFVVYLSTTLLFVFDFCLFFLDFTFFFFLTFGFCVLHFGHFVRFFVPITTGITFPFGWFLCCHCQGSKN
eukprot:1110936_1